MILANLRFITLLHLFQAEKRLCGTVSADKNEILFQEFNVNYNEELEIFKRGTILLRKNLIENNTSKNVIVDVHDDMLKEKFWKEHSKILSVKPSKLNLEYTGKVTKIISEQLNCIKE